MSRRPKVYYCFYCDKKLSRKTRTRDHKLPKSRNGSNRPHNIVDACRRCNLLKGSLDYKEFRVVVAYWQGMIPPFKFKFPGELRRQREDD